MPNGPSSPLCSYAATNLSPRPWSDRLDHFLAAGGRAWIFLNGSPTQGGWLAQRHLSANAVTHDADNNPLHLRNWDTSHPALAPLADALVGLLGVEFYSGFEIQGASPSPLATWEDGASAIAEVAQDNQHFLVSGFDLDREATNWTMQAFLRALRPFAHRMAG